MQQPDIRTDVCGTSEDEAENVGLNFPGKQWSAGIFAFLAVGNKCQKVDVNVGSKHFCYFFYICIFPLALGLSDLKA